jgi:hypothetical protein
MNEIYLVFIATVCVAVAIQFSNAIDFSEDLAEAISFDFTCQIAHSIQGLPNGDLTQETHFLNQF